MSERTVTGIGEEKMWTDSPNIRFSETLEDFFEINNVDMGRVSSWRDTEIESVDHYDLLSWLSVDALVAAPVLKIDQSFNNPVVLREDYDFFRSIYWSWGGAFRYDLPV